MNDLTTTWQGGFPPATAPPDIPPLDQGSITVVSAAATAQTSSVVRYAAGIFTSQSWSTGPAVPLLIRVLNADDVRGICKDLDQQLGGTATGIDDLPLRAFRHAARCYLDNGTSDRFSTATFGPITQPGPDELLGDLTWPAGVSGTLSVNGQRLLVESHLAPVPAGPLVPLRPADLRSLIEALQAALAADTVDPLWQQVLTTAEQSPA